MSDGPSEEPGFEPDPSAGGPSFALIGAFVEAGLVLLAFPLGWLLDQPPLEGLHWSLNGLLWGTLATLPLLVLFLILYHVPGTGFGSVRRFTDEVLLPLLQSCTLFQLFTLSLLAGLGEEILFRGVAQAAFTRDFALVPGLILASVLFGMMHAVNLAYAVLATAMGLYLGLLFIWTGDLLAPIVTHFLYDFFAMVYMVRRSPQE